MLSSALKTQSKQEFDQQNLLNKALPWQQTIDVLAETSFVLDGWEITQDQRWTNQCTAVQRFSCKTKMPYKMALFVQYFLERPRSRVWIFDKNVILKFLRNFLGKFGPQIGALMFGQEILLYINEMGGFCTWLYLVPMVSLKYRIREVLDFRICRKSIYLAICDA